MKVIIGHLFYDLLNLYGESGNILALKNALESQEIEVEVRNLSLDNEEWDLDDLDFVYMGAGTENNQIIALEYLKKHRDTVKRAIENKKIFLVTGNSIELFGQYIIKENKKIETLNLFNYYTKKTVQRIVSECIFKFEQVDDKILGFENHQGITMEADFPMFTIEKGFGTGENSGEEGYKNNNFYGTYLLGPILARNPKLVEKFCKDIILNKDNKFEFKDFNFELEQMAHDKFLNKYLEE